MLPSFEGAFEQHALLLALDTLFKLGVAVILGGAIGWEREMHGRPAGVRTHMLMCLGVTLLCEVSRNFAPGTDPSRIAAQIVTGVGFLGAGSILRMGIEVRGLTTAASIWAAASIGMAVSVGGYFYIVGIAATILALVTLTVVDRIEHRFAADAEPKPLLIGIRDRTCIPSLLENLELAGARVMNLQVEKASSGFQLRVDVRGEKERLIAAASKTDGVESATWAE